MESTFFTVFLQDGQGLFLFFLRQEDPVAGHDRGVALALDQLDFIDHFQGLRGIVVLDIEVDQLVIGVGAFGKIPEDMFVFGRGQLLFPAQHPDRGEPVPVPIVRRVQGDGFLEILGGIPLRDASAPFQGEQGYSAIVPGGGVVRVGP